MIRVTSLFALGRMIYALSQWLVMIYLARFLSSKDLGAYTYALAICGPIVMLSQMNMRMYLVTDASAEFTLNEYFYTRLLTALSALALMMLIIFVESNSEVMLILFIISIYKTIESLSDIRCAALQRANIISAVAFSNILRGISLLMGVVLVTYSGMTLEYGLLSVAIFWFLIFLMHDVKKVHNNNLVVEKDREFRRVLDIVKTCFPLGVGMALLTLNFSIPVYIIENEFGIEAVGVYSSIAYLLLMGRMVTESVIHTSSASLSRMYMNKNYAELSHLVIKMLLVNFSVGIFGILIAVFYGEEFLSLIYGERFIEYASLFIVVMVAALLNYLAQVFGVMLTIKRSFYRMIIISLTQSIVVTFVTYMNVDEYGLLAGGIGLASGFAVVLVLNISYLFDFRLKEKLKRYCGAIIYKWK